MKKLIYIAGPYTYPSQIENIKNTCLIADKVLKAGFAALVPHLTAMWDLISPENWSYESWLALDLEYLRRCDGMLRIEGQSNGADKEETFAKENNIPIFYSVQELIDYYSDKRLE